MMHLDLPAEKASINTMNFLGNEPENLVNFDINRPLAWITFSKFYDRPGNIALGDRDNGCILFCHEHDNVYEGHYLLNSKTSGAAKLAQCRKIFKTLFTLYEASDIVGHVPVQHFGARVMTRALGFASEGISADHTGCSCVNYRLTRAAWAVYLAGLSPQAVNT